MSVGGRLVVAVIAAVTVAVAFVALADATKFQPEPGPPGQQTSVTFDVDTHRYRHAHAARALWSTCVGSLGSEASGSPDLLADGSYRAWVRPALDEDARRRLRGCIRDATVDRVMGRVVVMVNEPVGQSSVD